MKYVFSPYCLQFWQLLRVGVYSVGLLRFSCGRALETFRFVFNGSRLKQENVSTETGKMFLMETD